jgi:outer membrane protein TolC
MLRLIRRALPLFILASVALRADDEKPADATPPAPESPPPLEPPRPPENESSTPKPKLRGTEPTLRVGGTSTQVVSSAGKIRRIALREAMALSLAHNLDVKFDKAGIKIDEARVRFAAGAFDPVFTAAASMEKIQRPDFTADINSASSLVQISQTEQIYQNTLAINALNVAEQQQTQAIQRATGQPVTPIVEPPEPTRDALGTGSVVVFEQDARRYEAGVQFRTPIGTRLAVTARQSKTLSTFAGDPRDIIPFYNAFGGIELRQPLLKDFGTDANLADLRTARVNARVAALRWEQRVNETVQQVMSTYFDMLASFANLAVRQDAIDADQKIVTQNQRRFELGFMTPFDVQTARAAVSTGNEELLATKNLFLERQFLLKRLVLEDYKTGANHVFVPIAVPDLRIPKIDRTQLLKSAFEKRLDYRAAVTEAEVQDIRLRFAKNQIWPQLDLVGSMGYNGLAFDYATAREKSYHSQAPEWSIGVLLSIPFGNVQSRAQLRAVQGFKEQALIKIKQAEQTVGLDVDTVISRIETLKQRLETARQTRDLNEEAVRIALRQLEEGKVSTTDVIETQRRLYDAKSRELAARAELNKAISQLWLATGTILEETGITIKR